MKINKIESEGCIEIHFDNKWTVVFYEDNFVAIEYCDRGQWIKWKNTVSDVYINISYYKKHQKALETIPDEVETLFQFLAMEL